MCMVPRKPRQHSNGWHPSSHGEFRDWPACEAIRHPPASSPKVPNARSHFNKSSRWLACCCVIDPGPSRSRTRCPRRVWTLYCVPCRCYQALTLPRTGEHAVRGTPRPVRVVPDRMFVAELRRENACHSLECFCADNFCCPETPG